MQKKINLKSVTRFSSSKFFLSQSIDFFILNEKDIDLVYSVKKEIFGKDMDTIEKAAAARGISKNGCD